MEEIKQSNSFIQVLKKTGSKLSLAFKSMFSEKDDEEEPNMDDPEVKMFFETTEKIDKKLQEKSNLRKNELQKQVINQVLPKTSRDITKTINETQNNNVKERND